MSSNPSDRPHSHKSPVVHVVLPRHSQLPGKVGSAHGAPSTSRSHRKLFTYPFALHDGAQGVMRIAVSTPLPPPWLDAVVRKVLRAAELPPDWNSYGASPPDLDLVVHALTLLGELMEQATPAPAVVPTPRGGLQFEWHTPSADLEIEVRPDGVVLAGYENPSLDSEWEGKIGEDLTSLREAIGSLSESPL